MASAARTEPQSAVPAGVPSLRVGSGTQFLLRRLHSLSGIFPIGAFLVEHYISNAFATNGVRAYNEQVRFLTSVPFVIFIETFFIYIPIAYHSLYGVYVWWRGDGNVGGSYPWVGNWLYTAQRWTGIIALVYIAYHTYTMRFSGPHMINNSGIAFSKVYAAFQNPWIAAFYFVGIAAASWHFAYGIWLFAAKWGITQGENARRKFGYVCLLIGLALTAIGFGTMYAFLSTPASQVPPITTSESAFMH